MELQDAVTANQSEIYFAGARYAVARRHQRQTGVGDAFSVGDYFWSSLGRQGRCFLVRLDALFVPMGRRGGQARQSQAHRTQRMVSVSIYYPTDYALDEVNFALQFKRVGAPDSGSSSDGSGSGFGGLHRLFAPPADHELLKHSKPVTMTLADFCDCVAPGLEKHSPDAWSARGLELPDFLASSGQRPRKCGKARVLVLSASSFNRLRRCSLGHGLFGWSREDALQCVGDNRLFQCSCGTRLFFCRRKHPLYHVNRHWTRQESLAPKHRGPLEQLSIRSEREALSRYQLHMPPAGRLPMAASASAKERRRQNGPQQQQQQKQQKQQPASAASRKRSRVASKQRRHSRVKKAARAAIVAALTRNPTVRRDSDTQAQHRKRQHKCRRRHPVEATAAAVSTVDSVIATVLSSCAAAASQREELREDQKDDEDKATAAAFQMRLEAISPPLEAKPQAVQPQPLPDFFNLQARLHSQLLLQHQHQHRSFQPWTPPSSVAPMCWLSQPQPTPQLGLRQGSSSASSGLSLFPLPQHQCSTGEMTTMVSPVSSQQQQLVPILIANPFALPQSGGGGGGSGGGLLNLSHWSRRAAQ